MNKVKTKESTCFVEGSLAKGMIKFALPLVATSILLQLFNTLDTSIAGRFISDRALAAVGSTATISSFFIEFFMGFSVAAEVIIARHLGRGNQSGASRASRTAISASLVCGALIAIIGILTADPLLVLMKVPEDIIDLSSIYLKIYFSSMPFYMLYLFEAAEFRSVGNTKTPMLCLVASGALKCSFDFIFVLGFDMGVVGMAIATLLSNAFSAILLFYLLSRRDDAIKISLRTLDFEVQTVTELLRIGLPSAFLGSVFSISNLIVQSAINDLGTAAIAASTAASSIEIYIQFFGNAFQSAATTYTAQNHGAGQLERLRKIPIVALLLCNAVTLLLSLLSYAFAPLLLRMFATEAAIISLAILRMRYTLLFKPIQAVMDIMSGTLRGYGYTLVPAIASIFLVCGVRILWINTGFAANPSLPTLMFIYPVTQALASLSHTACFLYLTRRMRKKICFE